MLRIMAEYQEPMARFRRERIQDTVVFFGSARFRALDVANSELELLANTGSAQPAPEESSRRRTEEIESGEASELQVEAGRGCGGDGAATTRTRGSWRGWWPRGRRRCPGGDTDLW